MLLEIMDASRNFRDFMRMYNGLTETCFNICVAELGSRDLSLTEEDCVAKCADKNVRMNHRTMEVFMELQPAMLEKRRQEAEEAMAVAEAQNKKADEESGISVTSTDTVLEKAPS